MIVRLDYITSSRNITLTIRKYSNLLFSMPQLKKVTKHNRKISRPQNDDKQQNKLKSILTYIVKLYGNVYLCFVHHCQLFDCTKWQPKCTHIHKHSSEAYNGMNVREKKRWKRKQKIQSDLRFILSIPFETASLF